MSRIRLNQEYRNKVGVKMKSYNEQEEDDTRKRRFFSKKRRLQSNPR